LYIVTYFTREYAVRAEMDEANSPIGGDPRQSVREQSIDLDRGDRVLGLLKLLDDPDAVDHSSRLGIIKCPLDRGHILSLVASQKTDVGTPVQTRNGRAPAHAGHNAARPRQALDQLVTQHSRRA